MSVPSVQIGVEMKNGERLVKQVKVPVGARTLYEMHVVVYEADGEEFTDFAFSDGGTLRDWLGTLEDVKLRLHYDAHGVERG